MTRQRQMYKMCELTKPVVGGSVARMISWVREEAAVPGQVEHGWKVESVSTPAFPEMVLMRPMAEDHDERELELV
jgi:hypothetical protein